MSFSAFAIRVVFLALPGIVGSKIYKKMRGPTSRRRWEDFVEVLLFALMSYAIWLVGVWFWEALFAADAAGADRKGVLDAFLDEKIPLDWGAIIGATAVSMILGLASAYNHTYSLLMRLAQRIRATKRTGDEDIWEVFHNSPVTTWCVVRDHRHNLMYFGFVRYYSDSEKRRELVLENVTVYTNDSGQELYTTGAMYLSRESQDMTIELPKALLGQDKNAQTNK